MIATKTALSAITTLFMGEHNLFQVIDFFFHLCDSEPSVQKIGIQETELDEGHAESRSHIRVHATTGRPQDRLGMLGRKHIDREIIKWNVDHAQQAEDRG